MSNGRLASVGTRAHRISVECNFRKTIFFRLAELRHLNFDNPSADHTDLGVTPPAVDRRESFNRTSVENLVRPTNTTLIIIVLIIIIINNSSVEFFFFLHSNRG